MLSPTYIKNNPFFEIFLPIVQIISGLALLGLSAQIAIQGSSYISALNAYDLNKDNTLTLLVIAGFIGGLSLLAANIKPLNDKKLEDFESNRDQ